MTKFKAPALPQKRPASPTATARREKSNQAYEDVLRQYASPQSSALCLFDATGSMQPLWSTTRDTLTEMIGRVTELSSSGCRMKFVAFRDYCDGNDILETSEWSDQADTLRRFVAGIQCHGGGDFPEAVEHALAYAVDETEATRVLLIGDAPPHAERDYKVQAQRLAARQLPVFAFILGNQPETERTFHEIADITGGTATHLDSLEDLLDCFVLTVAEEIGGAALIEEYLNKHPALPDGSRRYAGLLQKQE